MRSYKDPNPSPRDGAGRVLGERQARWLVNGLSSSRATWKIVAADLPIGFIVPDGTDIEGVANGLPGVPGGREHELAGVLRELSRRTVRNVVWLTADVHYTAAHHYSPDRAAVADFDPFLGDSSPARCTPARSGRTPWTRRSGRWRRSRTPRRPPTRHRWTGISTSARSWWMGAAAS
jgi:phosphodiesterase/alkaline phosphatase D-like protein